MTVTKSVRLSRKGQFVLPKEMRDALKVGEGDELLAVLDGDRVILTRPEDHARVSRGALRGTWGRNSREIARYLSRERQAWR
jgi:AbrB family looped-hinge helix DNA binding protein